MPTSPPPGDDQSEARRLGWAAPLIALVCYAGAVVVATYPRVRYLSKSLPGYRVDPLQHLWVMRWYRTCLLEGRSPVFSPEIQHPLGAPLGHFSPLHLQSLLYLPLSIFIKNDILCYNIIWFFAFLYTGFSVFILAWTVLRDRACAAFAGLLAVVCTPMLLRAHGHLELMFVGSIALFLASWVLWVDRPTRRGLGVVAAFYLLVAASAAYFAVLTIVPACLYVAWAAANAGRRQMRPWLRERLGWFAAFVALVGPGLLLVFSSQLWALAQGGRWIVPGRRSSATVRPSGAMSSPRHTIRHSPFFPSMCTAQPVTRRSRVVPISES